MSTNSRPPGSSGEFLDLEKPGNSVPRFRMTPARHVVNTFLVRFGRNSAKVSKEEIRAHSKQANVRCLECGWKYNFHSTTQCPICASDRTYLLSNGFFLASVATISIIIAAFSGLIFLAYKTITG